MKKFQLLLVLIFAVVLIMAGQTQRGGGVKTATGVSASGVGTSDAGGQTRVAAKRAEKADIKKADIAAGQPAVSERPLAAVLKDKGINGSIPNLKIVVDKSDRLLTLYSGKMPLKSYEVDFGAGGMGDKKRQGDRLTPEGNFYIAESSVLTPPDKYLGSRWLRVSYPNIEDARRGLSAGMIDQATYEVIVRAVRNRQIPPQKTALGGGIGIHGGSNNGINKGDNWTWGCIGLNNSKINEIFAYIPVGTDLVVRA